jgi:ABC-type transporter Mla subunit MlaD
MDKAAKIANKKYNNKQINTNKNIMKINESQLRKIIKESINDMLLNEYGEQQNTINEPNSQLLSMFVQESEQLRRSLAQFQDTARQIRQESMQLQNTVGFMQKFGNNLNAFGQQFMNYCNNFLNKLQPQQQRQQQQPMQQNNTNSQS